MATQMTSAQRRHERRHTGGHWLDMIEVHVRSIRAALAANDPTNALPILDDLDRCSALLRKRLASEPPAEEAEQEWRAEQQAEAAEHEQDERRWEAYMDAQMAEYQREAYEAGQ